MVFSGSFLVDLYNVFIMKLGMAQVSLPFFSFLSLLSQLCSTCHITSVTKDRSTFHIGNFPPYIYW